MRQSPCLVFAALLGLAPLAYGAGGGGVSPSEFTRHQSEQALGLKREQALRARPSASQSPADARRERRRLGGERFRQRLLLDQQRRWVASERAKTHSVSRPLPSRGKIFQRLRTEQASERFSRKLTR
jgi:hypothetical protein